MSDDIVKFQDESRTNKGVKIFGKHIGEIKCFRNSFLYGICGGVFAGLACFMMTSKGTFSSHVGFGSMIFGVLAYWIPCRYKYESQALRMHYYKQEMLNKSNIVQAKIQDESK